MFNAWFILYHRYSRRMWHDPEAVRRFAADCAWAARNNIRLLIIEDYFRNYPEYTTYWSWKTMKDFLEAGGIVITPITARQVIKDAFAAKVIGDGQVWIDMLNHRNLLSHTYDSSVFEEAVEAIASRYLPAMNDLQKFFSGRGTQ